MTTEQFVSSLSHLTFADVFNPYADRCEMHDLEDAPARRARTLLNLLNAAAQTQVDALWIGRDLGYRGGRRTGLALTDDVHLSVHAMRWDVTVERATVGSMMAERTAAVIWSMLMSVTARVFLWNVFPFHPHEPDDPFTNRSHNTKERVVGEAILAELIVILRPRRVIAIGNDAAKTAGQLAGLSEVVQVRHPSYGGQRDFKGQIRSLYEMETEGEKRALL